MLKDYVTQKRANARPCVSLALHCQALGIKQAFHLSHDARTNAYKEPSY